MSFNFDILNECKPTGKPLDFISANDRSFSVYCQIEDTCDCHIVRRIIVNKIVITSLCIHQLSPTDSHRTMNLNAPVIKIIRGALNPPLGPWIAVGSFVREVK